MLSIEDKTSKYYWTWLLQAQLLEHNITPNPAGVLGRTEADKVDIPLKTE